MFEKILGFFVVLIIIVPTVIFMYRVYTRPYHEFRDGKNVKLYNDVNTEQKSVDKKSFGNIIKRPKFYHQQKKGLHHRRILKK